jgi:hypothetical protein
VTSGARMSRQAGRALAVGASDPTAGFCRVSTWEQLKRKAWAVERWAAAGGGIRRAAGEHRAEALSGT